MPSPAPSQPRAVLAGALQALLFVAYPLVVYLAATRLPTAALGGVLLLLYALSVALRARGGLRGLAALARQHVGLVVLVAAAIASGRREFLLLLPTAVSLYLLWTFASSLRRGPPMIERFARMVEDDLPDFTLPYCRKVTWLWCGFLFANAVVSALLALLAPVAWWALYTGLLFYLLMGALLGGEALFRRWWFRHYGEGLLDRAFARLFPAERSANGRRSLAYAAARRAAAGVTRPSA